ncbi:hypothetical protein QTN25_008018 [Entamoeba marina]
MSAPADYEKVLLDDVNKLYVMNLLRNTKGLVDLTNLGGVSTINIKTEHFDFIVQIISDDNYLVWRKKI